MSRHAPIRSDAPRAEDFDWALVRVFLAVLDSGSFLAAARRLGSAQPTVGRQVESLERQLGLPLFERTGRGVQPTEAARRIAAEARRMQAGAERLAGVLAAGPRQPSGLVRISASRMVALHTLPWVLAGLQSHAPDIDVAVVATDEVSNLLRRDADIAIRMVRPVQASLITRRLGDIRIVPCAARHYLARWGTPQTLVDLAAHRLIGPDRDRATVEQMQGLSRLADLSPDDLRRSLRCDDFPTQFAAIRAGLGIGFASEPVVRAHPELEIIPLALPLPSLPLWLTVHREIRGSARIRLVYDYLARELAAVTG